jgi:hypothetical protein
MSLTNNQLIVPRVDGSAPALKIVGWMMYGMGGMLVLLGLFLDYYVALAGLITGVFWYGCIWLFTLERVVFTPDSIQALSAFKRINRQFTVNEITGIGAFYTKINFFKIAAVAAVSDGGSAPGSVKYAEHIPFDLVPPKSFGSANQRFILITVNKVFPGGVNNQTIVSDKTVIFLNWNDKAAAFVKQHYSHLIM